MPDRGFILLYRKFFYGKYWNQKRVFSRAEAFLSLIMKAQHTEHEMITHKGAIITVKRGEMITSLRSLREEWGWKSIGKVRRFVENDPDVELNTERDYTRIFLKNFDSYQDPFGKNGTLTEHKRNTDGTPTETQRKPNGNVQRMIKNEEELKEEREELLNPQTDNKIGGDSLSSLSLHSDKLNELLDHWNQINPEDGALKGCAHVLVWSYPAKVVVLKCFDTGYSLKDLKQAATNFQHNLNKKKGNWPATPLRIDTFYDELFVSYLPNNYKGGESEPDDSEIPDIIGNV